MIPKEKAIELIDKYTNLTDKCSCLEYMCICFRIGEYDAKRCALIAVYEICRAVEFLDDDTEDFWLDVKIEIEKL